MTLSSFHQLSRSQLKAETLDLLVVGCGYEERATFVAQSLDRVVRRRLSLQFTEYRDHPQRIKNQRLLADLRYEGIDCSGDDYKRAVDALPADIGTPACRRIGIDISSMTRAWYWGLTKALFVLGASASLEVFFFYTPSSFSPPRHSLLPPKIFGPIPGLGNSLQLPDRDISLIIGLGYEADKALGLVEYLETQRTWLFYTDPAVDPRFVLELQRANQVLFRQVEPENVIKYQFDDITLTFAALDSLVRGLIQRSRVLIAPLGPKPFGLMAFLLSLLYEEVDVWRVSGGATATPQKRSPSGKILSARAVFDAGTV